VFVAALTKIGGLMVNAVVCTGPVTIRFLRSLILLLNLTPFIVEICTIFTS
jgi:hypothetical protein